uniref:C-type lectin domain-containing protein n=1 Tax=Ascaris lumbricoides TaxID=6252 RepID=A0A0M3IFW3_ASCLU
MGIAVYHSGWEVTPCLPRPHILSAKTARSASCNSIAKALIRSQKHVPGRVPLEQARGFCTLLTGTLGWPNTMQEMLAVNARASGLGVRTYWLGLEKRGGRWVWQNNAAPTFTNWRGREPDGCCGGNVSCAIVGYRRISGAFWDDTSCNRLPPGLDGFFCRTN